jgi:hypothetical protein
VLPWYLAGGAARYCGGQGASCKLSASVLFGSVVPYCGRGCLWISYISGGGIGGVVFGYAVEVGEVD